MALSCGCDFTPGAGVSTETLKAHYTHTMEALMFWELLMGRHSPEEKVSLSQARIDFLNAIGELYPEAMSD